MCLLRSVPAMASGAVSMCIFYLKNESSKEEEARSVEIVWFGNVRIKGRREYVIKHGFLQQKLAGDSLPTLFVEVPGCSKSLSG